MHLGSKISGKIFSVGAKSLLAGVIVLLAFSPFYVTLNSVAIRGETGHQLSLNIKTVQADSEQACIDRGGSWKLTTAGLLTFSGEYACYGFGGSLLAEGETSNNPLKDAGIDPLQQLAEWLSNIIYYVMVGLFSTIAYIAAAFFSIAVQITLNSAAYALDFITLGWQITRDIANMAFIFILIYIAFTIMLKAETANTMKMLAGVIVVALIINFSFFLTRVVIDGGNVLAVQFYNLIDEKNPTELSATNLSSNTTSGVTSLAQNLKPWTGGGTKDLTASIMSALDVSGLLNSKSFNEYTKSPGSSFWYTLTALSLIYIAVGIAFAILAGAFLFAGAKFMMRTVALMFLIIASPLAFVARATGIEKFKALFNQWLDWLIRFSFYPAIFLFMFYILTLFMKELNQNGTLITEIFKQETYGGGITSIALAVANVGVRLGFVIAMLYIGLSVADFVVKEGSGVARRFVGRSARAAFGTAGWTGRLLGGGILGNAAALGARGAAHAGYTGVAKTLWQGAEIARRGSFDVRALPGVRAGLALGGVDVGTPQRGGIRDSYLFKGARDLRSRWDKETTERKAIIKGRMDKIEARQIARRQAELEPYAKDEERFKELDKKAKTSSIGVKEAGEAAEILKRKDAVGEEQWDKLLNEYAVNAGRIKDFKTPQILSMKTADIEQVVKHISEETVKAIKESGKRSDAAMERIERKWQAENKQSPVNKSRKELEKLDIIHADLKKVGVSLKGMRDIAKIQDGNAIINSQVAERALEELEATKKDAEKKRDGNQRGTPDYVKAGEAVRLLNKAITRNEKFLEELKRVPMKVSGREAPAEIAVNPPTST